MRNCAKCGYELPLNAIFCPNCGENLGGFGNNISIKNNNLIEENLERSHESIPPSELNKILKDFEKRKGDRYNLAKQELLEKLPLEALDPLFRLTQKIFIDEQKIIDAYEIIGEIGTQAAVDLLVKNSYIPDYHDKAIKSLIKNYSIKVVNWIIKNSFNYPLFINAIPLIIDYLRPEQFDIMAKYIDLDYFEKDETPIPKSMARVFINAAIRPSIQKNAKIRESALFSFNFLLPLEYFDGDSHPIALKSLSLYWRNYQMILLCKKYGYNLAEQYLEKSINKPENSNLFSELIVASVLILSNLDSPYLIQPLERIINQRIRSNSDYIAKLFGYDLLVTYASNTGDSYLYDLIQKCIRSEKDYYYSIITSVILHGNSALYPIIENVLMPLDLNSLKVMIFPIAYGSYFGIPQCKSIYDRFKNDKSKDTQEIIFELEKVIKVMNEN